MVVDDVAVFCGLRFARHKNDRHTAHENDGFYATTALDHLRLSDRQQKVGLTWMSDLDPLVETLLL